MESETQLLDFTEEELQEIKLQIEEWKDLYGPIYITEFEDESNFVWRLLTKAEFKKAVEYYEDVYDRAEYVCRLCILDPDPTEIDFSIDIIAGIPEILTENILRESGFTEDSTRMQELMEKYQEEMKTFDNQITCIIAAAFPYLRLEEIEDWTLEKTMWYYSRATWILEQTRGITFVPDGEDGGPSEEEILELAKQQAGMR